MKTTEVCARCGSDGHGKELFPWESGTKLCWTCWKKEEQKNERDEE